MAATYIWGAGFEGGSHLNPSGQRGGEGTLIVSTLQKHTGSYSLSLQANTGAYSYYNLPASSDEYYMGIWMYQQSTYDTDLRGNIEFRLGDGNIVGLRWRSAHRYDIYVGGVWKKSGSIVFTSNSWHNLQMHVKIANAGGFVEFKVNGVTDGIWNGDTQPGTSDQITGVYCFGGSSFGKTVYFDDIVVSSVDYPGDVRFDGLFPNGDVTGNDFDPSATGANYEMVDEVPASDADYVYGDTDTDKDKYDLTDWDASGKSPILAVMWARARKDEAGVHEIELLFDDGTESIASPQSLDVVFEPINPYVLSAPPSGGFWDDTKIDALQCGQRAQIA